MHSHVHTQSRTHVERRGKTGHSGADERVTSNYFTASEPFSMICHDQYLVTKCAGVTKHAGSVSDLMG